MWNYRASLIEVLDGDTIRLLVDVGFYGRAQVDIRLSGVRAPESNQPGGQETKAFVEEWFKNVSDLKWPLYVTTLVTKSTEPVEQRTFTRYVGVLSKLGEEEFLNTAINTFLGEHPEWGSGI